MPVLVLEASTTAAKALLYDERAGVVRSHSENYGPVIDQGGLHDAAAVYDAVIRVGRAVVQDSPVDAIGLGCVWHSIIACDRDMRPVTPAHLWNYTGTRDIAARFRADARQAHDIYRRTGCMPNSTYPVYSVFLMRENGLDVGSARFIGQGGYTFFRLTGEICETRNVTSGAGLLNLDDVGYDREWLDSCGIRPENMPRLVDFRAVAPLRAEAAAALGVKSGIPVVPAHADGALNQLGNGAMPPGRMTFSVGTSAAIRLSTSTPVLSSPPATWCYQGVDGWMSGAATNGACNCVNWFKERLLGDKWSYDELGARLLDETPAPYFLPFLFGERCPGWNDGRLGLFARLNGTEDAATLFRSLSEGILFNIYQCYRILTDLAAEPDRIILSGGILNSRAWTQMAADVFGRPMLLSDNPNASMLGAAALALQACGRLDEVADFGVTELEEVGPRPGAHEFYRERFTTYLELYDSRMEGTPL